MQEVIQFLNDSKLFFLATAEGDQPRLRPMGFVMEYEGKLCFITANQKPMFKQMKANPKVELCAAQGPQWLRVAGTVSFITSEAAVAKAIEVMPMPKNMYSPGDNIAEIFAFNTGATATFANMSGESKTVTL